MVRRRIIVGFLATMALILMVPIGTYSVLTALILGGWIGYSGVLALFIVPWYIVNHRRAKRSGLFDDKDFSRSQRALEYIREVKRRDVES